MRISIDDGCASDMRVYKLAKKYKVEAIFYWPIDWHSLAYSKGYEPLSFVDAMIIASEFEIGAHGITHEHLTKMPQRDAHEEIFYSGIMLQKLFDVQIKKFCPSRGYTNKELTNYTMKFYQEQRLTRGPGLVHVHPDSGANDNKPWRECVNEDTKECWMHSWELDKYNLWEELEEFLSDISS